MKRPLKKIAVFFFFFFGGGAIVESFFNMLNPIRSGCPKITFAFARISLQR